VKRREAASDTPLRSISKERGRTSLDAAPPQNARAIIIVLAEPGLSPIVSQITTERVSVPIPVVLIVEDEPIVRVVVVECLSELGLQVVEASDADEALAILHRRADVELLFTDITMPGSMDGLGLAREVYRRWPHISLLLTSGARRLPMMTMPMTAEFLPKPYGIDELAEGIRKLLKY
jgi:two-component system, response regulator PdtaR